MDDDKFRDGNAGVAQKPLHHILVHPHSRTQDSRPYKWYICQLQKALYCAIFAKRQVQNGNHDIDFPLYLSRVARQDAAACEREHYDFTTLFRDLGRLVARKSQIPFGNPRSKPRTRLIDAYQNDLVLLPIKRVSHIPGRLERYLVFRRLSAKKYPDAYFPLHFSTISEQGRVF